MRIYLAARYGRREEMRRYRDELVAMGHEVTASWIDGGEEEGKYDQYASYAFRAMNDLLASHCSIHFTEDPTQPAQGHARGGRHVELGIALHLRDRGISGIYDGPGGLKWYSSKPHRIIVVGPQENVFHWLPEVEVCRTWAVACQQLGYGEEAPF